MIVLGQPPELHTFQSSPSLALSLSRYTISLSLTRSASLSVLEDRLDSHIASVSTLPKLLERWGAQPMKRRAVIQKIGELMTLRMAVNTKGGGLDDTPEVSRVWKSFSLQIEHQADVPSSTGPSPSWKVRSRSYPKRHHLSLSMIPC